MAEWNNDSVFYCKAVVGSRSLHNVPEKATDYDKERSEVVSSDRFLERMRFLFGLLVRFRFRKDKRVAMKKGLGKAGAKAGGFLYNLMTGVVLLLFSILVCYLFFLAGFSTATTNVTEHTWLIADSFWLQFGIAMAFSVVVIAIGKTAPVKAFLEKTESDKKYYLRTKWILLEILLLLGKAWVLYLRKTPVADQAAVLQASIAWMQGDFSMLAPGAYLGVYPVQLGLVSILWGLWHIAGSGNVLFFQMSNALALMLLFHGFVKIEEDAGRKKIVGILTIVFGILFTPLLMYTTFFYGTLWGLCLSVQSFSAVQRFLLRGYQILDGVVAVLLMLLAIIFKSNYMIFLLAAMGYIFLSWLTNRKLCVFLLLAAFALTLVAGTKAPKLFTEALSHEKVSRGASSLSWIAMGMQENASFYDGWWNGFNSDTYFDNGNDTDAQNVVVKAEIARRVTGFQNDPLYALSFFARKNASQWNNPDFGAMNVNTSMGTDGTAEHQKTVAGIFNVRRAHNLQLFMNAEIFLILFLVLVFLICGESRRGEVLLYFITIIGGFIFHTAWEAKAQYTMPYMVLLLPVAALGIHAAAETVDNFSLKEKKSFLLPAVLGGIVAFAIIIGTGRLGAWQNIIFPAPDTQVYQIFLEENG